MVLWENAFQWLGYSRPDQADLNICHQVQRTAVRKGELLGKRALHSPI
jgi:hypothetical protein